MSLLKFPGKPGLTERDESELTVWRFWKVWYRLAPPENQPGGHRSGQPQYRAGHQAGVLCSQEAHQSQQVRHRVPREPRQVASQGLHHHRPPSEDRGGQWWTLQGCGHP